MVKRITWTSKAEQVLNQILEYYYQRNGNKIYSRRLNKEIKKLVSALKKHPYLGKKTETNNIRVLIKGNYKIIYELTTNDIIILVVWDCRQNPEDFRIE